MTTRTSPPAPSVEHVPTIFRRIRLGEIGVPAFQRRFLWEPSQVLSLFESVYKGFPIGSLLFWKVDRRILRMAPNELTAFPTPSGVYPSHFILDGLQRLTSLFGACYFGDTNNRPELNISFDLKSERFVHPPTMGDAPYHLPLSVLFQPKTFLEFQRDLIANVGSDMLLNRAIELHQSLQEYMIPIVTISNEEIADVVQIFERINSSGVKLGTVDFMRAITWSENFDLNNEIDEISEPMRDYGFDLDDEVIVKCLGLAFDLDPLPTTLLSLRTKTYPQLKDAFERVGEALRRTVAFFQGRLGLFTSRLVPYEAHILLLTKIFLDERQLNDQQAATAISWIRTSSWNEELTGRPDHYVAKIIREIADLIIHRPLEHRGHLYTTRDEIKGKRLITGKAMSTAFVEMLASRGVQSLYTGKEIDPQEYLLDLTSPTLRPVISTKDVGSALGRRAISAKVLSNIVVTTEEDRAHIGDDLVGWLLNEFDCRKDPSIARSQFLDDVSLQALAIRDFDLFLSRRAEMILEAAREYTK